MTGSSPLDGTSPKSVLVQCETAGEELSAIAGGAQLTGTAANIAIVETRPDGLAGEVPGGWRATAEAVGTSSGSWGLTVYAVCANVN